MASVWVYCTLSSFTSCHMSPNLSVVNAHTGLAQADGDEGLAACDSLNIEVIPTIQFWKNKQLLWEHRGVTALDQDLSEGADLRHASTLLSSVQSLFTFHLYWV